MNAYVMRDQARPLKTSMLNGAACLRAPRVIEVNLDHCALAAVIGLALGWLAWG